MGQTKEAGFDTHVHVLPPHIPVQIRPKFGVRQVVFAGLHDQPEPAISRSNCTMRADVWAKKIFMPDIDPRDMSPPLV